MKITVLSIRLLVCLFFITEFNAALAEESCQLKRHASLPITFDLNHDITVPLSINGRKFQFRLSTGSPFSSISRNVAEALDLHPIPARELRTYGFDGFNEGHKIVVRELTIDQLKVHNIDFAYTDKDSTELNKESPNYGGVLALNFLKKTDIEIDLYSARVNILSQDHCPGAGLYWTREGTFVNLEQDVNPEIVFIVFKASMNGHEILSTLSSTQPRTRISWGNASDLGLDEESPGVTQGGEMISPDGRKIPLYHYVLESLQVGGEKLNRFPIEIAKFQIVTPPQTGSHMVNRYQAAESLIGMDFLRKNHVYVAIGEHKLYFSPYSAEQAKVIASGQAGEAPAQAK